MGSVGGGMKFVESKADQRAHDKQCAKEKKDAEDLALAMENQLPTIPGPKKKPMVNRREEHDPESDEEVPDEVDSQDMIDVKSRSDDTQPLLPADYQS